MMSSVVYRAGPASTSLRLRLPFALLLTAIASLAGSTVAASAFAPATEQSRALIQAGAKSQQTINQIDDSTQRLLNQYKNKLQQRESLNAYNRQLQQLIAAQQKEHLRLEGEIQRIIETEREILPLIERMTLALERFIALDIPFLTEERADRVFELKQLIKRPDASSAEKFRRVIEAYQIENEYGRTLEAYQAALFAPSLASSLTSSSSIDPSLHPQTRTVNFLKIGRIALLYQSLDGQETGQWHQPSQSWQPLAEHLFSKADIKHAFQVAKRQAPPAMLMIPLSVPELIAGTASSTATPSQTTGGQER